MIAEDISLSVADTSFCVSTNGTITFTLGSVHSATVCASGVLGPYSSYLTW